MIGVVPSTPERRPNSSARCFRPTVFHEAGGPPDADKQTVRPAYTNLVEAPLAVPQDASGANNQVAHAGGDRVHVRRADKDAGPAR